MPISDEGRVRHARRNVTRLEIVAAMDYDDFVDQFERAVPPVDFEAVHRLVAERTPWEKVVELAAISAPHDFMIYWKADIYPLFSLAGHRARCIEYLMGNHTIAERMARHDAGAMLHAPLRTTIHENPDGQVCFALDRPSDLFAALGRPEITQVGRELDRQVGSLLRHLNLTVPAELT